MKLAKQMYQAISKGRIKHLEEYWSIYQNFLPSESQIFPVLADATASKILEIVEVDQTGSEKAKPYIQLWKTLEKNPQNRYSLA